jgi:RNA-directed DNA polymerase
MMHGREKSDPAIVAMKPANNAVSAAAELVERRAGAEGNARQQSTRRTQTRARVTQALDRVRQAAKLRKKERFTASSTMSVSIHSRPRSTRSSARRPLAWTE